MWKTEDGTDKEKIWEYGSTEKKKTIKQYNRDEWSNHKYISEGLVSWLSKGKPSGKRRNIIKRLIKSKWKDTKYY